MKIVAVNGSPHGKAGITNIMVSAFLRGAQESGAEIVNIFLAEKEIHHCKGCFSCWLVSPGQCVIKDDMADVLSQGEGTDILLLATPLKYANLSSMLTVFIERMLVMCNPYFKKDPITGMTRHPKKTEAAEEKISFYRSKLMMIANGGLPDRAPNFQIISDWLKRLAFYNHTEIIGEIYAPQGLLLNNEVAELRPIIDNYLQLLEKAGKEIVTINKISQETENLLAQRFLPVDIYNEQVNSFWDNMLSNIQHPYLKG